jgi:hypothetical protein
LNFLEESISKLVREFMCSQVSVMCLEKAVAAVRTDSQNVAVAEVVSTSRGVDELVDFG